MSVNSLKGTVCPVCYGKNTYILWSTESTNAAQHFVLKNKSPTKHQALVGHIEELWKGKTSDILRCHDCEFCYCDPYVAGDSTFYSLAFGDKFGYPRWKWDFQVTFENLQTIKNAPFRLLEIGAGNGAFVRKIIAEITPKENVLCTEFSEHGRIAIESMGITCFPKDIQELSDIQLKHSFDVICLFQVLEHMDELNGHFEKLAWLTKSGGNVYITVPNSKHTEFNNNNGGLQYMPPNHIGSWNRRCFEIIGARYGFQVCDFKIEQSSIRTALVNFSHYRFLRKSQTPGSLANLICTITNSRFRKILQSLVIAITSVSIFLLVVRNKSKLGMSVWVKLVKTAQ